MGIVQQVKFWHKLSLELTVVRVGGWWARYALHRIWIKLLDDAILKHVHQ